MLFRGLIISKLYVVTHDASDYYVATCKESSCRVIVINIVLQ